MKIEDKQEIVPSENTEVLEENIEEIEENTTLESTDSNLEEATNDEADNKSKKNSKSKKKKDKEDTETTNNNKTKAKSEEYYIKVQYPKYTPESDETFLRITATDKTSFKDSKEEYHKVKEEYKNEASEVILIGLTSDKEETVLHRKKFEQKDIRANIKDNLLQIIQLNNEILEQINKLQEEIIDLKEQKEHIEDIIKNTDYSTGDSLQSIHNDLIRLKYILKRIEDSKNIMDTLRSTLNSTTLLKELEDNVNDLYK